MRGCMHRLKFLLLAIALMSSTCLPVSAKTISKGIHHGDIVTIGESVVVKENATVKGDVVCIGADMEISGTVAGDAVSIGGALVLNSTAVIEGDAVTIGGRLERHEDAEVHGESLSIDVRFDIEGGNDARFHI